GGRMKDESGPEQGRIHPSSFRLHPSWNPVLVKELRTRMRGTRAYWIVFVYLCALAGLVLFTYYTFWSRSIAPSGEEYSSAPRASEVGQSIFWILFCSQGVLLALITPALTVGAFTLEREQRTYEMLCTSPLSSGAVLRGKLAAGVLFVVLLLTSSLPLASVCLFFGGVGPDQI